MDDINAIRAKRLAELSSQSSPNGSAPGGSPDQQKQAQQREEEEEALRQVLGQILDNDARERLSRIALVRPERSRAISELLVRMARSGQIRGKVTEPQLLSVLDQIEANERSTTGGSRKEAGKITFSRRKPAGGDSLLDSDDDDVPVSRIQSSARRKPLDDDDDFDI